MAPSSCLSHHSVDACTTDRGRERWKLHTSHTQQGRGGGGRVGRGGGALTTQRHLTSHSLHVHSQSQLAATALLREGSTGDVIRDVSRDMSQSPSGAWAQLALPKEYIHCVIPSLSMRLLLHDNLLPSTRCVCVLSICLSVCQSVSLSVCQCVSLSVSLSFRLSACVCFGVYVFNSVCRVYVLIGTYSYMCMYVCVRK